MNRRIRGSLVNQPKCAVQSGTESSRLRRLNSSDQEIRLLYLCPAEDHDKVRIRTQAAFLDESPRYIALSYVWGSSITDHLVQVDDLDVLVSFNLFEALSFLSKASAMDPQIPLWIDALSINQDDPSERSVQVAMMKHIYSRAYKVWVWLGPPSETTELALGKLMAVQASAYLDLLRSNKNATSHGTDNQDKSLAKGGMEFFQLFPGAYTLTGLSADKRTDNDEEWNSVYAVLKSPWWTRAWIAQEVSSSASHFALTPKVELVLGRQLQTISFRNAVALIPFLLRTFSIIFAVRGDAIPQDSSEQLLRNLIAVTDNIDRLESIRKLRREESTIQRALDFFLMSPAERQRNLFRTKIWRVLNIFRFMEASEPRDKIYASVQLVIPDGHPTMTPNYSLPLHEVFGRVVEDFIHYEGSLAILSSCTPVSTDLPSFAPDWRNKPRTNALCLYVDAEDKCIYQASRAKTINARVIREPIERGDFLSQNWTVALEPAGAHHTQLLLSTFGSLIDCVSVVSPVCPDSKSFRRHTWEAVLSTLPGHYSLTDEPLTCAYQRLLVGDIFASEKPPIFSRRGPWRKNFKTVVELLEDVIEQLLIRSHTLKKSYSLADNFEPEEKGERRRVSYRGALVDPCINIRKPWTARQSSPSNSTISADEQSIQAKRNDGSSLSDSPIDFEIPDTVLDLKAGDGRTLTEDLFRMRLSAITHNRVLCVTEKGYIGLGPSGTKAGDCIVVLDAGPVPFVLRSVESRNINHSTDKAQRWSLVGETYLHGIMDGEASNMGLEKREFVLV